MIKERRGPKSIGFLMALLLVLVGCLAGCKNGSLGLRGGSIAGQVVDSRTLVGIPSVYVGAFSDEDGDSKVATKYTTTDSNGNYSFSELRSSQWTLSFSKTGYEPLERTATGAVTVAVVNNETVYIPRVEMVQNYTNQYVRVRGTLKDAINGNTITYGNSNFAFGNTSFSNRLPTELTTGFDVPASIGEIKIVITVDGYKAMTIPLDNLINDYDLGTLALTPESYKIVGRWKDVPGWVSSAAPTATVIARSGNKVVSKTISTVGDGDQSFTLENIPRGTSVAIDVELLGYNINSPITVYPDADFQGTIYQDFSIKNNFSPIMRDVRVFYMSSTISSGDRVGAYCEETGTRWPEVTVTNPTGITLGTPQVIDLGTMAMPTGYSFNFVGYMLEDSSGTHTASGVKINDDGSEAQIVTIK